MRGFCRKLLKKLLQDEFGKEEVQCSSPNREVVPRSHVTRNPSHIKLFFQSSHASFPPHPLVRRIAIEADTPKASCTLSHLTHALGKVPGQPTPPALCSSELGLAETRRHRSSFSRLTHSLIFFSSSLNSADLFGYSHTNPAVSLLRISPAGLPFALLLATAA